MTQYAKMSNAQLSKRFARLIILNGKTILEAANVWMEMRERKMDLSHYPHSFHRILPLVAEGKLLASAVMELAGENNKLLAIAQFSKTDQRKFLSGHTVPVVRGDKIESRTIYEISDAETRRVFKDGVIQSPTKQKVDLKVAKPKPLPIKPEDTERFRRTSWRQAFKKMWHNASETDKVWARNWIKEA